MTSALHAWRRWQSRKVTSTSDRTRICIASAISLSRRATREREGRRAGDGQGLFVVRFVAQFFCLGKVDGGFVLVTYLLVRDVPVVIQEQVRLAIRPSKHDALPF